MGLGHRGGGSNLKIGGPEVPKRIGSGRGEMGNVFYL